MKIVVQGLWHLGAVTAACLAAAGHTVVGLDGDAQTVAGLQAGLPPIFEPGLEALVQAGLASGRLHFTTDPVEALDHADLLWVTYDTPVDEEDRADVSFVLDQVAAVFSHLPAGIVVLISSQLPVGSTRQLAQMYAQAYPERRAFFACSPENLRLGKAIESFTRPDRVVVGTDDDAAQARVAQALAPFTDRIEWMAVASAEMTKHALNAFLATSVTFINELAILCEQVGADAKEVERGLKTDARIGPRAYLGPGSAFAGGTLARDVAYLIQRGQECGLPVHLMSAVQASNQAHQEWPRRQLRALLYDLRGQPVAVLGLTYKPGTNTLRRSSAVETCLWLHQQGARVQAYDPLVSSLPDDLAQAINLQSSVKDALCGAVAVLIATGCPEFRSIAAADLVNWMAQPIVIDPDRFLVSPLAAEPRICYIAVGQPFRNPSTGGTL
ncbi:MAG: UDP-glucose/GDP-mannose dehydrogenase family protein [Anaerolineales bacterium]|nr:UDP-glucose/GDP-mannose dehydrogenase family protein [Anaerolineales bacterium]